MLEGLEISEVMLSEVLKDNDTNRIDSEYFKKKYLDFFQNVPDLEPLANFVEDGYRVVYESTEIIDPDLGQRMSFPYFLQATDLETPFIRTDNLFYVDESEWNRYPKGRIKKGEILIEVKGKLEKVSIVPNDFPEKTLVSGSLFKLTVNERINKHVLLCYLICKYGVAFKDRYKTNLLISYISKPDLYRIPIPNFSLEFQNEIDRMFKSLYEKQKQSKYLYSEAEDILLSELGLKDWQPNNAPVNIKHLKDSFLASGRLDAEYYQPKYENYAGFIRKYRYGSDVLGNICSLNEKNFNPLENSEYKYIELSDIGNSGEITGCTSAIGAELPSRARRLVHTNDVIVSSIEGSLQSVALVTDEYDKAICSTGFYVVESETINPETLLVLFKSEPMQNLLKQGCSGTILTAIGRNELQNVVMPKIKNEVQKEIAEYVQKSISLRKEAKQLLENAKLQVEDAIFTPPFG